ncbi:ISL3 family transposase, partial [Kytococcus schroeteri]
MPDATFATPDVTTFCRLDELGLVVVGQQVEPDRAVLLCRVEEDDAARWRRRCGCEGRARDTVTRKLAHEPLGWRPTTLLLTVRRYKCTGCGHVWRQDTTRAAEPRAKLSRTALRWALVGLVCQHLTVARLAEALAVSWDTANAAVLAEGQRLLLDDPTRFDDVKGLFGVERGSWGESSADEEHAESV